MDVAVRTLVEKHKEEEDDKRIFANFHLFKYKFEIILLSFVDNYEKSCRVSRISFVNALKRQLIADFILGVLTVHFEANPEVIKQYKLPTNTTTVVLKPWIIVLRGRLPHFSIYP